MERLSEPTLLHEAFDAQAARTPDALAVAAGDLRLTYRELERRASCLAHHLRTLGVGPEVRVGVCLERGAEIVVGLLAVLKAGGAYVPLDPLYPQDRLTYMLTDSRAEVLLTETRLRHVLPAPGVRETVLVDAPGLEEAGAPEHLGHPDNLAYLIYTSGSTGRPKGVAIEHRSAVALLRWAAAEFPPGELAGVLASTSVCFDLSVFEIFVPLALGGTVIVAGNALDLPYLPDDPPVTLVNTVPSAMAELVRSRRVPGSVRVVNLAGEALPGALVEEIYRTTSVERVLNLYGPSEDTTYSTGCEIARDASGAPPIGLPLPGTRAWLLDRDGLPVPFGEEGELYLAGEGLARGYLGRPELTAERFVPDPFADVPGARMYRTGDLARHLPDGQLHYLGRADHQVKIRGFRIELGEIEGTLARHSAVREAAVLAEEDEAAGKRLVAFLAVDGEMPGIGELRAFAGRTLPAYMIPSLFRRVDALPRTLNGKVDRRALAAPGLPEGLLPLSFAQQRLWFLERLKPGEPTYNEPLAFDLAGPVDRAALAAAFGEIVRRHEVLRTRYVEVAGTPFQEVLPPAPFPVPFVDLGALPEEVREAGLRSALAAEIRRPFDFGRPPLLRAALFGRGGAEHTLVLTIHHIAYDGGRTRQILVDELSALYGAAREGRPSPLPPPVAQYGDFARREQEAWKGIPAGRLEAWRRLLAGAPALVPFGDRPRPATRTSRGVTVRFLIPADRVAALRTFARAEGATLFKALFALLTALLGRVTGRRDGVVGTTVAGRTGPEAADTVGFFINVLPIRVDLSGSPGLSALLARVRNVIDEAAAAREDLPYEQLVAALRPERGHEAGALFEVLAQRLPTLSGPALSGLEVTRRPVDNGAAKFSLEATLEETGAGIEGFLQGSADLYEAATLDRFAARFRALLEAAIEDPDRPLDEIELPFEEETLALVAAEAALPAAPEPVPGGPSTPAGEILARIWCEVLGLGSVAPGDNFFHLGGHSLLGARVLSRVRDLLGVDLPVQALFRTPTVGGLARAITEAAPGGGRPAPPPVRRAPRRERQPLSFAQERLWFFERLNPGSPLYNVPLALRLDGKVSPAALEAALGEAVRRHEVLRTRFGEEAGRPYQEVCPPAGPVLPWIDLAALPEAAREAELARLAREEARTPFDLAAAPLLRARLIRLGGEAHAFLWNVHHVVFDGGSQGVLNRELSALYEAALAGHPSPLPELPVQYADYVVWQRGWLARPMVQDLVTWWSGELAGAPTVLEVPADRPRPEVQAFLGAVERTDLPAALADGLSALARRHGATRFLAALAAFQALLGRLTGQDDLLVGAPCANRPRPELEGMIGLFVETLVLRGRLGGDPPFCRLLGRVRETAMGAFAHQEVPFEELVAGLEAERSLARNPLIQVMFSLQDGLEEGLSLPGIALRPLALESSASRLDLSLIVEQAGGRLRAFLEYNTDLFEAATARRFLDRFLAVLESAVDDPGRRLSELRLLSAAEERRILTEWSGATVRVIPGESLTRRIEEQARRAPDALAVAQDGRSLSFGELDRRAGRLAARLRRLGVGPETRVAVGLPRSIEGVVALLAVWKAGGAYLPLDPSHPLDRLAFVLADAGAPVLIARGPLAEGLAREGLRVVDPDDGEEPAHGVEAPAGALAYVIYTSGSTGRPKGVEVSLASLLNLVAWHQAAYGLTAADRTTLLARVGFDASVWELWPTLAAGASLWLPEEDALAAPEALRDGMVEQGITVAFVPTPLAELLLGLEWPERTALRVMLTGGDALRRRPSPGLSFTLVNHYGPTEATVVTTAGPVAAAGTALPAIGRPIAGARVYVVDAGLSLLPPGVPGELCIGGAVLARGYLGAPAATAERYVPDPFAAEPGSRLYRTGDRVRLRPDGEIEFLGRIDRQVKLRGFRLELGEIEAALARHPALRDAAVVLAGDGPGGARLVAFASLREGAAAPAEAEVFTFLRQTLPEYMVPSAFVPLPALPLSPNGKLDRRALEKKVPAESGPAAGAARTPEGELLAQVWCDVLGLPAIGPRDDFFRAGGHSLLAAVLLSRVRDVFGVSLPVQALFRNPTVESLAEAVAGALRGPGLPGLAGRPPVARGPRTGLQPLSFAQERFWFLDRLEAGSAAYNVPLAFRLAGRLAPDALEAGLREVVRRHEALRTRFVEREGSPLQEVVPGALPDLPRIDLAALPKEARRAELGRLSREEARALFDLARAPLLRTRLLGLAPDEHVLLLTVHHAVFDGWSLGVLSRELSALYAAAAAGSPSPLPELPVQYPDYAAWQRSWLTEEGMDGLLAWWRRELQGVSGVLELPADRPRPEVQGFRGALTAMDLPAGVAEGIAVLGRSHGATRFMVLLAAFQALLARWAGQDDLVVGSPSANRPRPELEGLIGLFVETVALRGRLGGDPTVGELLARTRETALGAFGHQDLPFERLVADLGTERSPSRNPLIQTMFSFQDGLVGRLALPGVAVQRLAPGSTTSKLDLILFVEAAGGELRTVLEYDSDLFEAMTARRLLARYATVLAGAVANPAARLSELPLLWEAERHQILAEWNDRAAELSPDLPLHRQVEAWARRAPDALAVAQGGRRMTYGELDRRAGRLARRLARLGAGLDVRVVVCLPRSCEWVATLLAVFKAGGGYVALDPAHPAERLAALLEDSGAPVLVARGPLANDLARPGLHVVDPDDGEDEGPLPAEAGTVPAAVAYVVYTSGSTGRPKGVEVSHGALLNFVASNRRDCALGPADRVPLAARVAWDGAVWDVWPTLASGASLHAPEDEVITAPEALRDFLVAEGCTVAFLTTPLAELLLDLPWPAGTALRILQAGGDTLRHRPAPGVPFLLRNHYGPTETTVIVTGVEVAPEGEGKPTIGRPLANVRAHVVDRGIRALPAGVPGELVIGGVQVSRGYLGNPAATAERYVPDPFAAEPGARLYRTGDLVRLRRDGEIEFLGRLDRQVKLRGHRLELGEIEAALRQHPALRDAAVMMDEGGPLGRRLVAFGALRQEPAPPAEEVFAFLRRTLPDYMVPAAFVPLDALPLTSNRKIDRRALAALLPAPGSAAAEAPSTPAAELMTQVWARVLGLPSVGPRDDFFHLGGHSLLATRLLAEVRATFGVPLPVRDLFSKPTPEGLAELVAEARGEGGPAPAPPIRPVPRGGGLPLSFAQEALWFIHALDPASTVYQIPSAWRLHGALDATALEAALAAVARRHEALRTRFPRTASGPVQEIGPGGLPLPRIDLAGLPAQEREEELARLVRAEAGALFDLARGPLARARLALLSPGEHALLFTVHHAVFDGGSLGLLERELEVLYEAALSGAPAVLPALPVQYADFAVWQRSWLAGEALARRVDWWRRELEGAPAVLDLPTDRPRPRVQTFRGAWELLELSADRVGEIRALGRREGATLFMTLLAGFQTLLHRWAGQDDVLVGSPVSNRSRPEIEGLLGYFVDTVVLRGRCGRAGETVREVFARVRETALDVFAHQDLPFERLVSELQVERDLSYNPLFQVMLALAPPASPLALPGVVARPLSGAEPPAMFDLTLDCAEDEGRLAMSLEFNTGLYDRATARRLLERFAALLAAFAADPGQRVEEIPLLTGTELQELVAAASRSAGPPPEPRLLHRLFVDQAARTPDAVAVLTPAGERLTYAELDRRSARLARFLRRRGVGPDVPVGVCLERSPELVVALFGILRAGGAYLPLDPAYPPERLAFLLADSGAPLVLTRSRQPLPQGSWEAVALDALAGDDLPAPEEAALPESLAYLIYTSGSTGRPKAVGVSHAVAAAHLEIAASLFGLGAGDRFLQFSSPSFDMALEEIVTPLLRGASLLLRESELWEPSALLDRLVEHGVTAVNLPTAYWHQWAAELETAAAPAELPLRLAVAGGEGMSRESARRWGRSPLAARVRLVNAYGPTEAVITSTVFEPGAEAAPAGGMVPIGLPIPGRSAWVLDRSGQPVPAGVPGELCLGGPLLARGYAGRPDLTAERFVPYPFAGEPGARLYRTGDRVRRRPDGILDFLGRIDRQVKVRGFRIEPGEVEAALSRHPAVREAVVDLHRDLGLVAWIVPAPPAPAPETLRDFLRASLPEPLIPAAFVAVPELPLTPHGKVDRRALPAPVAAADEEPELPRDPVEEMVAGVWMDVLGLVRVSRHDNFFELGGHSLRATQLASRLRQAFDVDLPLRAIFEDPTPARLAARVRSLRGGGGALLPPVTREERPERVPLSFAQQRLWFLDRLAPDRAVYNVPVATTLSGPLAPAALEAALTAVFRRHEALRTRFVEIDGQPWQEIAPPGPVTLPRIDLGALPPGLAGAERDRLGREEARRPFDLARGPLLRSTLIRLGEEEHTLLLTAHHIVSDAWSEGVLGRELSLLYAAASEGLPSPLPELPIQYADFALWQRRHIEDLLGAQLEHWRGQLGGLATLELPTDRPRPPVQSFRGAFQPVRVPEEVTDALREISRHRGATLFMVLLAAWQTLLGRLSGQTDVAVGSPVANRNRAEIEGLIGFFINMLAFRSDLGGDPPFAELLERVRRTALDAYGHQDVPFERLVDELRPERDLSRQPLVQVMIAVDEGTVEPLALPGIAAEPLTTVDSTAKFDLTLYLGAEGGGFAGAIEHATDLFDAATVRRWAGHLVNVLTSVAARPDVRLSEAALLSPEEWQQVVHDWNDTRAPFPEEILLHQFFEEKVDAAPGAVAAVWEGEILTYGGLEARANRIAGLLRDRGIERGAPVGVWMERSLDMVAAVLAVLKAGAHYLPLDAAWPADRVEGILARSGVPVLLTRAAHLGPVLEMQWRLPALADVVCLDEEAPQPAPEPLDPEGVRALFDLVAERAVDRVTAGGFVSGETGLPFSEAEVDEYRDRVVGLAAPFVRPEARVLEIGSGSGLILWEIAPRVSRYVGLDPSPLTQEKNRARAAELGLENVELPVGFAHEIEGWPEGSFDLVILASTVQFFPGPLYLARIVDLALHRLAPGGALLVADVPDARRKDELRRVLSLDEDLFRDFGAQVLHRESGFDNELRLRYDVLIEKDAAEERPRRKNLWTSWHVERRPASRLPAVASPEDVAYVIHTSGSTGQPKGIVVQHRPVANLIHWINHAFGIGPEDRVLFVTSLCFDLSVWDLFGLLAAGGSIHVASEEDLRDAERLVQALLEEPITVWDSAPAALVRLAPLFPAEPAVRSRLRRVMLSGDWIPVTLPDRVRAAFPGAEVTSLGGATEATVWSNWYPVGPVDPRWPSIPYGRPIANARYHVLDAGLAPCPVGVPGDLHIGGDCLCVGYAQEPALTAAAFVPDPFAAEPGARLYRTGDRARFFADGNLEFLGRVDQQVKIRGFRIELGEIEVALARHPGVYEAVVLAREDVPGDKRLVAYVVPPAGETAPDAAELRDHLRRDLPEYMVPGAFVALPALPVTANGKLDRRALPAPRWDRGEEEDVAPPATPAEEALAALWREVLGVSRVGRSDNFFDLGGHSLLATQLVARVRETFGVEVALRTVFQSPSLAELAAALDAGSSARPAAQPAIRPVPREGELPLSASQLRQWFLVQLDPESTGYNIPIFLRLEGALRREVLAAALGEIARRHETLRTTFPAVGGRPVAVVSPRPSLPLPLADVGVLPEAVREAEAARLAVAWLERPFDVAEGPLARALLVRLAPGDHLFAFVVHHIVFDGWSMGVFLRELTALYEAFAADRPSPLPELPVQYVDYAAWQREWLLSPDLEAQAAHWKQRLAGSSRTLDLPTDRPRPAVLGHHGALVPLAVSERLAGELKAFAGREGSTLFMLLLSGYAALLSRYSGQDDFNVGTFVANRRQEVLERLIGFFVNTLVLRTDLTGDPGFGALLARVRETTLDAFEHQEVPFESLLEALETGRDLSRTPLFQVMFGVQNFAVPTLAVPGLAIRQVHLEGYDRTNTDLVFWMWEEGSRITGWIQLNTDLFDGATGARMFGHMMSLLAAALAAPEIPLSELPLLGAEERQQILTEWGTGAARPASPRPVHERIREEARRAPDAVAAVAGDRVLSYGELDRRAGRVARGLLRFGAGPGTVVGLSIDRTPEMLVALYGILGTGAAYLPLDPKLPAERMAALVEDAGAPWVLSRRGLADALPPLPARALFVDLDFEDEAGDGLPDVFVAPESAAYVLYTSGSTGAPKGVVVEHRALAGFVDAAREIYGIGRHDRVLQFASLSFDTSAEEIYPCLAAGGTLVLRDEEMLASPAFFLAACGRLGVTLLDLPTAYWHELAAPVASGAAVLPPSLRLVILGGERALPERVHGWLAAAGPRPLLVNTYGPTEATVIATACDLAAAAPAVPIGRPIPGAEAYLLDRDLRPVPAGVPGEIVLGGGGLARGYLGRPDLTAERFVPSPFGPPGARLYRTGDLGRWLPSGQIDFVGRVDDQVKIRGFRIEPGEIAAALARHPAVREAVAVTRETGPGERRLAAYAVPAGEDRPSSADLRAFLKERLPDYMVPADVLLLEAFPLTRTGKVDRRALPAPEAASAPDEGYAPPGTPSEEILAGIWQELLGLDRPGIYDNFFDVGGHSLLAPQLFSRIAEVFGIELPLRVLFEAPTIAQLANAVEQALLAQIEELSEEEAAVLIGGDFED